MDFEKSLIELQKKLSANLHSETLLPDLLNSIGAIMGCKNVLLLAAHGNTLGAWGGQTQGWKVKSYSLDVTRRALQKPDGYQTGGTLDANPSESQIAGNILSCVAAAVKSGEQVLGVLYCDIRDGIRRFG